MAIGESAVFSPDFAIFSVILLGFGPGTALAPQSTERMAWRLSSHRISGGIFFNSRESMDLAEATEKATSGTGRASGKPFRILIADDEPNARDLIRIALSDKDYELLFFENGESALEECHRGLPDLAILDFQMPGQSGLDVCRWIKQHCGRHFVPTLLLTS